MTDQAPLSYFAWRRQSRKDRARVDPRYRSVRRAILTANFVGPLFWRTHRNIPLHVRAVLLHDLRLMGVIERRSLRCEEVIQERRDMLLAALAENRRYFFGWRRKRRVERVLTERDARHRYRVRRNAALGIQPLTQPASCGHKVWVYQCPTCVAYYQRYLRLWRGHRVIPVLGFQPPRHAKSGGYVVGSLKVLAATSSIQASPLSPREIAYRQRGTVPYTAPRLDGISLPVGPIR